MKQNKNEKDIIVCSTCFPVSNIILKLSGVVSSTACHESDYENGFMLALSNPDDFWKSRLSEELFDEFIKSKEYDLIKEDFEDLNRELYITNAEYREATLNIIFEEKVNALKNL